MSVMRILSGMFLVTVTMLGIAGADAQNYPGKPIRIVTGPPGIGNDSLARVIAPGISGPLGQPVIVDNRGGTISVDTVAKAQPDGYTLLLYGSAIWIAPLLRKASYDPVRDFSPITLAEMSPNVLVLHPSVTVKTVKELIALAKAKPGELNYSSGPSGGTAHLAGELFKSMAGVNIVRVPYKSGGMAFATGLIGGEVQLTFASVDAVPPHLKSGRLRALAVTGAEPSPLAPGLPTVAASGVPGYEVVSRTVILAPAQTPAAIISQLNREIVRFLTRADVKEKLLDSGVQAIGSSPEALAAIINVETAKWSKLIKDAGIAAD